MTVLRAVLAEQFSDCLPEGVHRVSEWCADPQFFPGATGLLTALSWDEVTPGSMGVLEQPPPAPEHGVLVVGNCQAILTSYRRILDRTIGGFATTWRVLRQLMASVPPVEVFLTNAFIGLPDVANDTTPFPTTPEFWSRCGRLLAMEIELFRPRAVVCMGVPAARMLATVTQALAPWRPWSGYSTLRRCGDLTLSECRVGDVSLAAVAVRHPAAVLSAAERALDAAVVQMPFAVEVSTTRRLDDSTADRGAGSGRRRVRSGRR